MIQLLKGKVNVYENDNKTLHIFENPNEKYEEPEELPSNKILVFDGTIDGSWIDYINVIHSNKKVLYLENNNSVNMEDFKIVFETTNLKESSPSFVKYIFNSF